MTFRRPLLVTVIVGLLIVPQAALAREVGATWESETQGLPVSTTLGRWTVSDDGRSAELIFAGGHLIEAGTTFRATWLTPFTTKDEVATFESSYEVENENQFGENVRITQSFRFREKGEEWWPWMTSRHTFKPGSNGMGGGSAFEGGDKDQVQFEWRWTGRIVAPTFLRGSAILSIN
jgi:hypothetical protein